HGSMKAKLNRLRKKTICRGGRSAASTGTMPTMPAKNAAPDTAHRTPWVDGERRRKRAKGLGKTIRKVCGRHPKALGRASPVRPRTGAAAVPVRASAFAGFQLKLPQSKREQA